MERNPEAMVISPTTHSKASVATERPDLIGVKGWLAFFAISLIAIGPLLSLGATASEISSTESAYPELASDSQWAKIVAVSWGATLISCAISIFAGWRLYTRLVPSTVPIVICCLWALGPGSGVLLLLIMSVLIEGGLQASDASAVLVRPLIYAAFWTAYLTLSRRVKNTYNSDSQNQIREIFE